MLNQPNSNLSKDSHSSDSEKTDRFAKLYKLDWVNLQLREDNFYEIKESLNDSIGNNYTNVILCGAKTYGDDQFYKSIDLTAGVLPVPFEVDVTNLDKIKIKIIRTQKKSGNSSIGIVNGKFIV